MDRCPACGQSLQDSVSARVLAAITTERHEYSMAEIVASSRVAGKILYNALGGLVRQGKLIRTAYGRYRKPII